MNEQNERLRKWREGTLKEKDAQKQTKEGFNPLIFIPLIVLFFIIGNALNFGAMLFK
ncbi:hypothetical protein [Pseudoalteromonas galatheae]|uniref:hypothetical protein n=1 Tax=Pseudoalteromonas galatheae TaxID=579562 RepID=UPI0030D0E089